MKLVLVIDPCEDLTDAARNAQHYADICEADIEFDFNSVRCIAEPNGDWEHLAELYSRAQQSTVVVRSRSDEIALVRETAL